MAKVDWSEIYGPHADLLAYSKRRKNVLAPLQEFFDFLDEYICNPDPDYPEHRDHLSNGEWRLLVSVINWRFGLKTYQLPMPSLSWWSEKLHISRKHLIKMYRFLVRQALLRMPEGHKQGRRLCFGVDALCEKVREWLRDRKEIAPVVEKSQPEPDPWDMPEPISIQQDAPEPEGTEEEVPDLAALERAPEWTTVLERIKEKIPHAQFNTWLRGTKAYKRGDQFIIEARSSYGKEHLKKSYLADLILSILTPLLAPSMEVFITAELPARSA